MRLLLDTHTFLWAVGRNARLSAAARVLLADPANHLLLSVASYWEIAVKVSVRKLVLTAPFEQFVNQAVADLALTVLPVSVRQRRRAHALAASPP